MSKNHKKPGGEKFAEFKLSSAAMCLEEGLFTDPKWVRWWKAAPKSSITVTDHMNGEVFDRDCVPIVISERPLWADVKTGTLYDARSGRCLSANLRTATVPEWTGGAEHGPAMPSMMMRKP